MPRYDTLREIHGPHIEAGYQEGQMGIRELSGVYQCSPGTIRNILIERGVKLRRRGRKRRARINQAEMALKEIQHEPDEPPAEPHTLGGANQLGPGD